MRDLTTKKKLILAIAVLTVLMLFVSIFLISYNVGGIELNNGNVYLDNGGGQNYSNVMPAADYKLGANVLTAEQVSKVDDGSVGDSRAYIAARGYATAGWTPISSAGDLMTWLQQGESQNNAYLTTNISNFTWYNNSSTHIAPTDAAIQSGKTLDGCGYTLSVVHTGGRYDVGNAPEHYSLVIQKVSGVLKNLKVTFATTASAELRSSKWKAVSFQGLLIGCIGDTTSVAADSGALVENINIELTSGLNYNRRVYSETGWGNWSDTYFGCLVGQLRQGTIRNITVNNAGGTLEVGVEGGGARKVYTSAIIGAFGSGDLQCSAYNLRVVGNATNYPLNAINGENRLAGCVGSMYGSASAAKIVGMYVEKKLSGVGYTFQLAVGIAGSALSAYNKGVYSKVDGTWNEEIVCKVSDTMDFMFDKAPVDGARVTNADYEAKYNNIIVRDLSPNTNGIIWNIDIRKQNNNNTAAVSYDLYADYTYGSTDNYIKMPAEYTGDAGVAGNPLRIEYGEEYELQNIGVDATYIFDGYNKTMSGMQFVQAKTGATVTIDQSKVEYYYDGQKTYKPRLPRENAYIATLRAVEDANYSYLDIANKKIAKLNNSITANIIINNADVSVSRMYNGNIYNDEWISGNLNVSAVMGGANVKTEPYRIEYRSKNISDTSWGIWGNQVDGATATVGENNNKTIEYSFRLLVQDESKNNVWVPVTNGSDSITYRRDDVKPTPTYSSTYVEGTWNTTGNVLVSPQVAPNLAPARVEVRFPNSSNAADREWHAASEWIEDSQMGWVNGFILNAEGVTVYELRAISDAGVTSDTTPFTVKIDTTDYQLKYHIYFADSGREITAGSDTLLFSSEKSTFKRNEQAKYKLTADLNDLLSFIIVDIDGKSKENLTEYNGVYNFDDELGHGAEQAPIIIKVKKRANAELPALSSMDYGTDFDVTAIAPIYSGIYGNDDLGLTINYADDEVSQAGFKNVGTHVITATSSNKDYIVIITDTELTINPKLINIAYSNRNRFIKEDYWGNAEIWKELGININSGLMSGDTVNITGITYVDGTTFEPVGEDTLGGYGRFALRANIDNTNYRIADDNVSIVIIAMFEFDYDINAYKLSSAADIKFINGHPAMLGADFILTNDIDASEFPGLRVDDRFTGHFDGNNHKIYNLTLTTFDSAGVGFFTSIDGGTVENLFIENVFYNVHLKGKADGGNTAAEVAVLAGSVNNATVRNVNISGVINLIADSNVLYAGAIVGRAVDSVFDDVISMINMTINASGKVYAGGLIGEAVNVTVKGSTSFTLIDSASASVNNELGFMFGSLNNSADSGAVIDSNIYLEKAVFNNKTVVSDSTITGLTAKTYKDFIALPNFGEGLKQLINPVYFGEGIYGTDENDAFIIDSYSDLELIKIYPFATFKLANDIVCFKDNSFDISLSGFAGSLLLGNYKIMDYNHNVIMGN